MLSRCGYGQSCGLVTVTAVLAGALAVACGSGYESPADGVAAAKPTASAVRVAAIATAARPAFTPAPTAIAATAIPSPVPEPTAVPTPPPAPTSTAVLTLAPAPAATPTVVPTPTATPDAAPAYLAAVRGLMDRADALTERLLALGFVPPEPTDEWAASIEEIALELGSLVDEWQRMRGPPAFAEFHRLYLDSLNGWLRVAQVNAHWPRVGPDLEQQLAVSKEFEETFERTAEAAVAAQAAYESAMGE